MTAMFRLCFAVMRARTRIWRGLHRAGPPVAAMGGQPAELMELAQRSQGKLMKLGQILFRRRSGCRDRFSPTREDLVAFLVLDSVLGSRLSAENQ